MESSGIADILEMAELLEPFAAMGFMLDGLVRVRMMTQAISDMTSMR